MFLFRLKHPQTAYFDLNLIVTSLDNVFQRNIYIGKSN